MKNKSNKTLRTFIAIFIITIISFSSIYSQENGIYEINYGVSSSKSNATLNNDFSSQKKSTTVKINRDGFYELANKIHPTVYLEDNSIANTYGLGKITKLTLEDTKSYGLLDKYNDVELITIKIKNLNDLNNILDLTKKASMPNLKYIFIKSDFECTNQQIQDFLKTVPNIRVFYKTDKPS